ncbi:MAG: alpha/beta fold hydrolase [Anaerolineae bacterium]|nr:alpha/beta fold hydrolase [Anaerolineae bacterium]
MPDSLRAARQPFSFNPGVRQVGVLCVHGFTGSPAELRPLGEFLAGRGYAVEAPLLPGHGGMPHELKGFRWTDWVGAARQVYEQLCARCASVYIAGLSMGGLIALHLAAHSAMPNLRGVIVMAAPAGINDPRARLVSIARFFVPYHYPFKGLDFDAPAVRAAVQKRFAAFGALDLDNLDVRRAIVEGVRIPVGAIHELIQFNQRVMRELGRVKTPALLVQGRLDQVVQADSADVIAARLGATDKRVIWYANSAHELPLEPDAPALFADVEAFIQAHLPEHVQEVQP